MNSAKLNSLARRLRVERREQGLTLKQVAERAGLAASTLSKVENGLISLSFRNLRMLARGLQIDVASLFDDPVGATGGRRSVTRKSEGKSGWMPGCHLRLLATDLLAKRLSPMIMTVTAHTLEEADGLKVHGGEEVYFVISGDAALVTDQYAPLSLSQGDCVYMDGRTAHAFISVGDADAVIFAINEGHPVYSAESGESAPIRHEDPALSHAATQVRCSSS